MSQERGDFPQTWDGTPGIHLALGDPCLHHGSPLCETQATALWPCGAGNTGARCVVHGRHGGLLGSLGLGRRMGRGGVCNPAPPVRPRCPVTPRQAGPLLLHLQVRLSQWPLAISEGPGPVCPEHACGSGRGSTCW